MLRQKSFNHDRQVYEYDILNPDGEKVGMAQLRLIPSKSAEMPEGFESHVYYEINQKHRNKDYATKALEDLLKVAQGYGLNQLVATVNADNPASIKVIEKCGGERIFTSKTAKGTLVYKYIL